MREEDQVTEVRVAPPKFEVVEIRIRGTAPYVQSRFSEKCKREMLAKQEQGDKKNRGKKDRLARDLDAAYRDSMHRATDGDWCGIPAAAFRSAMISACRLSGLVMTRAKLTVFVIPDGFDSDGEGLVRICKGDPRRHDGHVRLATGVASVAIRAMWDLGWESVVRVRYDADQIDATSVVNLLSRAGHQVGIGEGRADSKRSCGCGWGSFEVVSNA